MALPESGGLIGLLETAAASLIGTLVAAAVALRFAIMRLRREKAFEQRFRWHESTAKTLATAALALRQAVLAEGDVALEKRNQFVIKAVGIVLANDSMQIEAEMYASPAAYRAIRAAIEDVAKILHMAQPLFLNSDWRVNAKAIDTLKFVSDAFMAAASRLAADVRVELALPSVRRAPQMYDEALLRSMPSNANTLDRLLKLLEAQQSELDKALSVIPRHGGPDAR
jgi:hypothetical protein